MAWLGFCCELFVSLLLALMRCGNPVLFPWPLPVQGALLCGPDRFDAGQLSAGVAHRNRRRPAHLLHPGVGSVLPYSRSCDDYLLFFFFFLFFFFSFSFSWSFFILHTRLSPHARVIRFLVHRQCGKARDGVVLRGWCAQ